MNLQKRAWQIGIIAGSILSVYLLALAIGELKSIAYIGSGLPATNTISVSGSGDAYAVPDIATFSFGVNQTAKTVAEAQSKATDKINAALKVVRDAGIEDKDIQTTNYSINPHYEYQSSVCPAAGSSVSYCPPGKSVLTGYDVGQTISIKVRDLDKAGTIFASIGSLGVDSINGLSFSVDKPDAIQAEARSKAIIEAQSKAQALAKQLGVRLVRIVNFSEDNGSYPRPIYGMGGDSMVLSAKAVAAPEIPAGQQKVTSNVSIMYEIQ